MLSGLEYQRINGRETAYRQYAWDITTTGLLIAASFTFSWMFLAFPMIVGNLGGTAEENRDNLASTDYVLVFLQILISVAQAPVFAVNAEIVNDRTGRIDKLKERGVLDPLEIQNLEDEVSRALKNGLLLGGASAGLCSIFMACSQGILLNWFHQNEQISERAGLALDWAVPSVSLVALRLLMEQILIPLQKEKLMTKMALGSFGIALMTAILVGIEEGLPGVTAGFMLGDLLTAVLFTSAVKYHKDFKAYGFLQGKQFLSWHPKDTEQICALAKTGSLFMASTFFQLLSGFLESMLTGKMGHTSYLAALALSSQILSLAGPFLYAFGTATQRRVLQETGKAGQAIDREEKIEHYCKAQQYARSGLFATEALVLPICIAACAYPRMLTTFMGSPIDEETLSLVDTVAMWMGVRALAVSAANNAWQVLIGIGDGSVATALLVLSQLSGVTLGAFLAFYTNVSSNPLTALVAGGTMCQSLGALALVMRAHQQMKSEVLAERAEAVPVVAATSCFRTTVNSLWSAGARAVSCFMPQISE